MTCLVQMASTMAMIGGSMEYQLGSVIVFFFFCQSSAH
jgi:hypothetical protein